MKCFYHNDADGKCSAFWVKLSATITDKYTDHSFIEIDYSKRFPIEHIRKNEQIYIVDYSISIEDMKSLLKITDNITWIDHHKTAIEKYKNFEHNIRGIRCDGIAGCMLTYCYLHHMTQRGEGDIKPFDLSSVKSAPLFTRLIADWDVWKFEYGDDTRNFIVAFNAYDFSPMSEEWNKLLFCYDDSETIQMIKNGAIMTKFRDGWAKSYCKSKGFEIIFEDKRCFAMNLGLCNSEYFNSIDDGSYDILMPFSFDGNIWTVSLYSKTTDVSEIAKKYGGGGHKGASGFQCKILPFNKNLK